MKILTKTIFITTSFIILLTAKCLGQDTTITYTFNPDISKSISRNDFDSFVNESINLLQTKQLSKISDSENIMIIMCLNTILVASTGKNFKQRFKGGQYEKLEKISNEIQYVRNLIKVYPDTVPNRGMGLYFLKLKMEVYGTPRAYAYFYVLK